MRELWKFAVSIPAGTLKAAPLTFNLTMPPREVEEIAILVPPGPRGEVGFKVAQAGNQVYPSAPGDFIVTDNETVSWPVSGANTSGAWQVIAYNTGGFAHTLEFRFSVNLPTAQAAAQSGGAGPAPLDLGQLVPGDGSAPASDPGLPGSLSAPPASPPPGSVLAPTPPGVPGPQAPSLPGLPAPPPLPGLPVIPASQDLQAILDRLEAVGQSNLQASAASADQAALLDKLEASGQAAHQGALAEQAAAAAQTPPTDPDPGLFVPADWLGKLPPLKPTRLII